MFRWLKDRKKQKKTSYSNSNNDYGFRDACDVNDHCDVNKNCEVIDDYDVNLNSKDYHVYEEIGDIPSSCLTVTCTNGLHKQTPSTDGPYMIVPIPDVHLSWEDCQPNTKSRDSIFTCALIGRRNSSMSGNTGSSSSGVDLTYDLADSQKYYPMVTDSLNSNDTQVLVSTEGPSGHCRDQNMLASSDTGCEYDISTSSEGDPTSYESYLQRIEQNLAHKCKIREIIQQVTPINEESDSDSMTTVSSVSMTSHRHPLVTQSYSDDEGTLADYSESENSSGYYETEFKSRTANTTTCELVKLGGSCDTCKRHNDDDVTVVMTSHFNVERHQSGRDACKCNDDIHKQSTRIGSRDGHKRCVCTSSKSRGSIKRNQFVDGLKQKHNTHRQQTNQERKADDTGVPETNSLSKHKHLGNSHTKSKSRKQVEIIPRFIKSKPSLTVISDCHGDDLRSRKDTRLDNSKQEKSESKQNVQPELYSHKTDNNRTNENIVRQQADNAEEYEYREVYSGNVSDIRTRKSSLSNKVAKSRNFDSVDIYKSRTSNNRLLSDLIINNYHERQLLFG